MLPNQIHPYRRKIPFCQIFFPYSKNMIQAMLIIIIADPFYHSNSIVEIPFLIIDKQAGYKTTTF